MLWLDVYCPGHRTSRAIDIRTIDRYQLASVGSLVLGLRCRWCSGSAPMAVITGAARVPAGSEAEQEDLMPPKPHPQPICRGSSPFAATSMLPTWKWRAWRHTRRASMIAANGIATILVPPLPQWTPFPARPKKYKK
jgi:hypothetical protein